jgi:hypothetical protein
MIRTDVIAIALVLLLPVPAGFALAAQQPEEPFNGISAPLDVQLEGYVLAQEALAADNYDDAKAALDSLVTLADPITQPLVRLVAAADNIELMRTRFKPLSEYLAALDLPQGFARAYCPMYDNGSNWVQRDGPVRNPYYGSEMLTCGVVDAAPGAHMDHSPRHGGIVFMAPDSFHHIEGTFPEPGLFRLYATDNYREPVDVSTWTGRAVTLEEYDEATDEFVEVRAFDLFPSPDGEFLEALIPTSDPNYDAPAEFAAKVIFQEDFPAERFDFIFASLTTEAAVADALPAAVFGGDTPEAVPLAQRILPDIPDTAFGIAMEIASRDRQIQDLIARGAFTEIFIPALQAKELALALQRAATDLPPASGDQVRIAVRHLVRSAYLLDWYGDLGNKNNVDSAYAVFGGAVGEINAVYDIQ